MAGAARKYLYRFSEGRAGMRDLLGGKGAGLCEMTRIGLRVPAGFVISTEACTYYYGHKGHLPPGLDGHVARALAQVERQMGRRFGDPANPLLVSVRSGARASMPGMMDTVLNLGLNEQTLSGLIATTGNERFAYDTYRRFISMYGNVVLGLPHETFEHLLSEARARRGAKLDTELGAADLRELVASYKAAVQEATGMAFPDDPQAQLWGAIAAVIQSWNTKRAITYRRLNSIPDSWGTAVTVQSMVFGNLGEDSATGVAFTRNPSTGERTFYGEYLPNAQGEDVVAGIRTPRALNRAGRTDPSQPTMEEEFPRCYRELVQVRRILERHYQDMMDIEFTIQQGKLYILQCRSGKRTAHAALKIAVDMVREGLLTRREALLRIDARQLDTVLHPSFDPKIKRDVVARGLPASPGAAVGKAVFSADEAVERAEQGEPVILVRAETSPEDIHGMAVAQGILTSRGGMTSHAAVVGRGMGKCCIVGCGDISVNEPAGLFTLPGGAVVRRGELISIDGGTGEVMLGQLPTVEGALTPEFKALMKWADGVRRLGIRTNADLPHDAQVARKFGAEGIGLTRTEHMFFGEDRLPLVRRMILAENREERVAALGKLLPLQREDFKGLFSEMAGLPVTIRLLDPPLHEFLPHTEEEIRRVSEEQGIPLEKLTRIVEGLKEFNPMLGHRGCRLGITYPEVYDMQTQAIFEAACELRKEGIRVVPEVMIPLVGDRRELELLRESVERVAAEVMGRYRTKVPYKVGTMIELPRAALTAGAIAEVAEFFSFGTNDLTQMTYGFSRDDSGKFLKAYLDAGILQADPFQSLDTIGVGELVRLGTERGRKTRRDLKVGICGEHGGDPRSIEFCHQTGLDYVSCSPYRVPIARLAAAQAALRSQKR